MEIFSMVLALCEGNPPVTGGFSSQRPVTWSSDVFFELCLNKQLSNQDAHDLRCHPTHYDITVMLPALWNHLCLHRHKNCTEHHPTTHVLPGGGIKLKPLSVQWQLICTGIILCMHPANERWRYIVTSSPIGWVHTQNDPCMHLLVFKASRRKLYKMLILPGCVDWKQQMI